MGHIFLYLASPYSYEFHFNPSSVNWGHLLRLGLTHRIIPVLNQKITQTLDHPIHLEIEKDLANYIRSHRKEVLRMTFESLRLFDILKQQDVQALLYKGPLLALLAYGDTNLRSFDDLDILVTDEDYFKVRTILQHHGYITPPYIALSAEAEDRFRHYFGEYPMVREKTGICLDIHRRPLGNGDLTLFGNLPQLWNRLITITIAGKEIQTFSHSDLLIYLCMNGFKDGWEILRSVCDVAGILQRQAEHLEWDYILSETRQLKIDRILGFGLLLAHQLLEAPIPEVVLAHIKRDRSTTWLVDRVCRKFMYEFETLKSRNPIEALILKWVGLKYGSARRKYVFGSIERVIKFSLAINYRDTDIIQLPKPLHFLYYLIRPLRILRDYRQNIFKFLVK
jgi:hypothetical protein